MNYFNSKKCIYTIYLLVLDINKYINVNYCKLRAFEMIKLMWLKVNNILDIISSLSYIFYFKNAQKVENS